MKVAQGRRVSADDVGRRTLVAVCLAALLLPLSSWCQTMSDTKPQVLILTTGGTIASRSGAPLMPGDDLVQAVPELREHSYVVVEEFSVIGSSKMTPDHWLALARRVNAAFSESAELSGIVITHGTDTLEETAYFLNLTVKSTKPVVLVGSMRSSTEISADGPANLVNAVRVAGDDEAADKGVLVVLNEDISAARDVWKTDNRRVHTFQASNVGHIGSVDPDGVRFYRQPLQRHTAAAEFDVSSLDELPNVIILSDFTGIDASLVADMTGRDIDGLVVRTFAGGRMSAGMLEGLGRSVRPDLPVVVTSRVPGGRIVEAPDYPFSAVVANGQPDNKARILLMLALTVASDVKQLQRIFDTY